MKMLRGHPVRLISSFIRYMYYITQSGELHCQRQQRHGNWL